MASASVMHHQHQQGGAGTASATTMPVRVPAMPLTPSKRQQQQQSNRSRQTTNSSTLSSSSNGGPSSSSTTRSTPNTPSKRAQPRWEDIMKEAPDRLIDDHQVMPEDELEDLLRIPIAAELRSKRSKASVAASSISASTSSPPIGLGDSIQAAYYAMNEGSSSASTSFPSNIQPATQMESMNNIIRKRSQSNPARANLYSDDGYDDGHSPPLLPQLEDFGIPSTSGYLNPSNIQSSDLLPTMSSSSAVTSSSMSTNSANKKARIAGKSSIPSISSSLSSSAAAAAQNTANNGRQPTHIPVTPTNNNKTSGKGVNSNSAALERGKSESSSGSGVGTTPSTSTRKQANITGGSGPRRPTGNNDSRQSANRQVSTPLKRAETSGSPKSSTSRPRASSTSLLSRPSYYEWDETSKPPWLDENPTYLYKSDIESTPAPGSLAYMALQAQGRLPSDLDSNSNDADASFMSSSSPNGGTAAAADTSIRSWDDVILPAVAKQIRAQQLKEAQKQAEDSNEELLVTDWNIDGTPKKWQRVSNRKKEGHNQNQGHVQKELPLAPDTLSSTDGDPYSSQNKMTALDCTSPSTPHGIENVYNNPSFSSQQVNSHHRQNSSIDSHTNSLRPSHYTGRRELWENPALKSPNTARTNGFQSAQIQNNQSFGVAMSGAQQQLSGSRSGNAKVTAGQMYDKEKFKKKESKNDHDDGSHGSSCCKCTIM